MVRDILRRMHALFPSGATEAMIKAVDCIEKAGQLSRLKALNMPLINETKPIEEILAEMDEMANTAGLSPYTVYLISYLFCADELADIYKKLGYSRELFEGFMKNIVSKMQECFSLYGIWGVLHGTWLQGFLILKRYALGTFIADIKTYPYEAYTKEGITVQKGSPVYCLHIPYGASLKKEDRLKSYKLAYSFFQEKTVGKYMCFVCNSWLLHPCNKEILPETSAIRDFASDFEIIRQTDHDVFKDAWRVFGADAVGPMETWPTNTSMQRGYIKWLIQGGKTGDGFGIMLFDGEHII